MERITLVLVVAIVSVTIGKEQAFADTCDDEVSRLAGQIGATAGARGAGGMVALIRADAGEITYGCHDPGAFLTIFSKQDQSLTDFLQFLGLAGQAFTGQSAEDVRDVAEACVNAAKADSSGYYRQPFGKFTLDCGGGHNGTNAKVSFEESVE